jgi:hypothetical protein
LFIFCPAEIAGSLLRYNSTKIHGIFFVFSVLSLFVQRKNQRKGAGNDNFSLFVRPLHYALTAPPKSLKFAPFP